MTAKQRSLLVLAARQAKATKNPHLLAQILTALGASYVEINLG